MGAGRWHGGELVTRLPDCFDQSRLLDAPVGGDQREVEGERGRDYEPVPRVAQQVSGDRGELRSDLLIDGEKLIADEKDTASRMTSSSS